jgi:hypothetical protein
MVLHCQSALVTLATLQLEKLVQFYSQLSSQQPTVYIPQVYAEFQLPGLRLGIFKPKVDQQAEFRPVAHGPVSLCLEVPDLYTAIAHFHAIADSQTSEVMNAAHGREIYVYDPDGNRLILYQPIALPSTQHPENASHES